MKLNACSVFAALAFSAVLTGCYNDPKNLEKSVVEGKSAASLPKVETTKVDPLAPPAGSPDPKAEIAKKPKESEAKPLTAADLGLPPYPNAKPQKNADGSERIALSAAGMVVLEQETTDAGNLVDGFYQRSLAGASRNVVQTGGKTVYQYLLSGSDKKERMVEITAGPKTLIRLAAMDAAPASPAPSAPAPDPYASIPPAGTPGHPAGTTSPPH